MLSRPPLKDLGRDAGFEDELDHYNYRRWTANGANRNFTSQERKRVLGQSGDGVFERHYQSEFVQRDLQHVVLLLRPSQEGLLRELKEEMRSQNAREPFPNLYHRHDEVKKSLAKLRKTLLLGKGDGAVLDDIEDDEEGLLPIPEYIFPERARLVEAFYGPEAESFEENQLLARRIQVTKNMVAFSRLCEPNRRGKRVNWEADEKRRRKRITP
ncbi:hypothetical protein Egran_05176 [Elaphomyces granulatus]|uniref:Uncharacterized protein n=1 Tax=Elaphomyces granulatus TaxID=519963 RepID=A0A232LTC3_9EURO|nr:hypothetical protein Egran_05176 [Elaphomyces granulatus]